MSESFGSQSFFARALVPGSTSFVAQKEGKYPRSRRNQPSAVPVSPFRILIF